MDIHPLIAHFPIALLIVGVVCDAIGILNDRDFFVRVGYLLFLLGALTAIPVALTGDSAAEVAQHIDGIAADLEDHDTLGTVTAFLAVALALVRTHFVLRKKFVGFVRYAYLVFGLVTAGLVCAAGYTGGHLVFFYGAGTKSVTSQIELEKCEENRRIDE